MISPQWRSELIPCGWVSHSSHKIIGFLISQQQQHFTWFKAMRPSSICLLVFEGSQASHTSPFLRMYLWWSLYTFYLLVCQAELRRWLRSLLLCPLSVECYYFPLFVDFITSSSHMVRQIIFFLQFIVLFFIYIYFCFSHKWLLCSIIMSSWSVWLLQSISQPINSTNQQVQWTIEMNERMPQTSINKTSISGIYVHLSLIVLRWPRVVNWALKYNQQPTNPSSSHAHCTAKEERKKKKKEKKSEKYV